MRFIRAFVLADRPCVWMWHPRGHLTAHGANYLIWALKPGGL